MFDNLQRTHLPQTARQSHVKSLIPYLRSESSVDPSVGVPAKPHTKGEFRLESFSLSLSVEDMYSV
jgi:hypothetical protein